MLNLDLHQSHWDSYCKDCNRGNQVNLIFKFRINSYIYSEVNVRAGIAAAVCDNEGHLGAASTFCTIDCRGFLDNYFMA